MPRLKKRWLPYEVAALAARKAMCRSRKEFHDWHNAARPNLIPKYPPRVYQEWTSWNDFLNTTNTFGKKLAGDFRPYWECVRWVQKHARAAEVDTVDKWCRWYDAGNVPQDIPKYPNNFFPEWKGRGWGVWLGKTLDDIVTGEQMTTQLVALANDRVSAKNVIFPVVSKDGIQDLGEKLAAAAMSAVVIYEYEDEKAELLNNIFSAHGRNSGSGWIIGNVNALLFDLDNQFDRVDLKKAAAAFGKGDREPERPQAEFDPWAVKPLV